MALSSRRAGAADGAEGAVEQPAAIGHAVDDDLAEFAFGPAEVGAGHRLRSAVRHAAAVARELAAAIGAVIAAAACADAGGGGGDERGHQADQKKELGTGNHGLFSGDAARADINSLPGSAEAAVERCVERFRPRRRSSGKLQPQPPSSAARQNGRIFPSGRLNFLKAATVPQRE